MNKKKIGIIAGDVSNGLTFQRIHLFMRYLKYKYEFYPMNFENITHAKMFYLDAVIFAHPYHPDQARIIHRSRNHYGIKTIIDIDDLTTNLPSDHHGYRDFKGNAINDIIMLSDAAVFSTDFLRKNYGHLNKNNYVIENCIDERRYVNVDHNPKKYHSGFVVGWTGSQSHRPDLYNTGFIEGLIRFMEDYEQARAYFHLLCPQILLDKFGSRIIFNEEPVDYLDYPSLCYTYPFDVCAHPLYKHPFNDAKSDLRLLDMAPYKIPLIVSPRESFKDKGEMVQLCEDGTDNWYQALTDMFLQNEKRKELAEKAYTYVMSYRLAKRNSERWIDVIEKTLNPDPHEPIFV